jgi:uncharacterized membrane protein
MKEDSALASLARASLGFEKYVWWILGFAVLALVSSIAVDVWRVSVHGGDVQWLTPILIGIYILVAALLNVVARMRRRRAS